MKGIGKLLLVALVFSCIGSLQAQGDGVINIGRMNTDMKSFIDLVAQETGKNILYDSTVVGKKIFLAAPTPVTKKELFKIFLSVMEYNNYILERTGRPGTGAELIKIKRNIQGPWTPTPMVRDPEELERKGYEDSFITMVIKLRYISAREVQTTLRALRIVNPQGGNLAGIEGSNTILITDFAPNVKRIYEVIQMMDEAGPQLQYKLLPLKNAIAGEVVEHLQDLLKEDRRTGSYGAGPKLDTIKIIADKRLNAIIVWAYASKLAQMEELVAELDKKLSEDPSTIHYIRLKHADAIKLEETLSKLIDNGGLTTGTAKKGSVSSSQGGNELGISIQAEPQTNSLIVQADEYRWREIKAIIQQVDVRSPQVMIEAALVEVSPRDVLGLGVEVFWGESPQQDRVTFSGGSSFGFSNLVTVDGNQATPVDPSKTTTGSKFGRVPLPASESPFSQGILGLINFDKDKDPSLFNLPLIFRAIQTQGDFKIQSLPFVLTNDNQKAEIRVSEKTPTSTVSQGTNSDQTGFSGYQEAGTILLITPHISGEKNYLRLDLEQTIDEFDRSIEVAGVPGIQSRKIVTSITVPDNQTIAIGGLTFDSMDESIRKIPLLGDLPLIGFLFQTRIVTHRKRNIYLFVTPRILREKSFDDLVQFSYEKKIDMQKYGINVSTVDKEFTNYQKKYGFQQGELPPLYMLDYKSPKKEK